MFELALSLPLLVNAPTFNVPVEYAKRAAALDFYPLAYSSDRDVAEASYVPGVVQKLDSSISLKNYRFGPAPKWLVQPVFSVESLN